MLYSPGHTRSVVDLCLDHASLKVRNGWWWWWWSRDKAWSNLALTNAQTAVYIDRDKVLRKCALVGHCSSSSVEPLVRPIARVANQPARAMLRLLLLIAQACVCPERGTTVALPVSKRLLFSRSTRPSKQANKAPLL